jgi:phage FluMu gp28-like protein
LWSGHRVDIYDAVRSGLKADINLLRSGCDDEETWLQEYCCQFLSGAANYIPVELIGQCVHEEATSEAPAAFWNSRTEGEFYLGIDIGRKRDLTVAWLFEKVGGILWSRHLLVMKGLSFDEQEKQICGLIDGTPHPASSLSHPLPRGEGKANKSVRRVCVDQSGIGMMLAEHLVQRYGGIVEPVTFTSQFKERIAPIVQQHFEDRAVRIPDNRFWALALVVNAASEPTASFSDCELVGAPITAGFHSMVL